MPTHISKSRKLSDGVCVWFADKTNREVYYAWGIMAVGSPGDIHAGSTMHGWISHMRPKRWFTPKLEEDFKSEVLKYF